MLADPATPIDFSIAHSGDLVVWTVGDGVRVGVDIEEYQSSRLDAVTPLVLSSTERSAANRLDGDTHTRALWRSWVRKEAVLKAIGVGLQRSMSELDLGLDSRSFAAAPWHVGSFESWSIVEFRPLPNYLGALAVSERRASIHLDALDLSSVLARAGEGRQISRSA